MGVGVDKAGGDDNAAALGSVINYINFISGNLDFTAGVDFFNYAVNDINRAPGQNLDLIVLIRGNNKSGAQNQNAPHFFRRARDFIPRVLLPLQKIAGLVLQSRFQSLIFYNDIHDYIIEEKGELSNCLLTST